MKTKNIILKLRTERGMSQDELADKIMVTRQAVSRWENGDTVPNTDTLKLLSKEFDVSINTLLGEPRKLICQCCGMPIDDDSILGRDKDGTLNEEYCKWCYADGTYTYNDMDELIDVCVKNMVNENFTEEQARSYLKEMLPKLDYWKRYDELSDNGQFEEFKKQLIEEILIVALHLFARDGYEAVSVSQIAGELDMTKGALYRHYKSKRDIFDSIVKRMEQQDSEQARENEVPEESIEKTPEEYQNVSFDDFVECSKSMFEYWTEDDFASSFRKMLTIEQFRSEGMQKLYQQYLVSGPAEYVKDLLKNMEIKNPEEKAVKFYANMFFYYSVYDGASDKVKVKCQFEHMLTEITEEIRNSNN